MLSEPIRDATRRARVLFIDHTAQLGGGEIALRNLIINLDNKRIEPVILLFSAGPLADQLETKYEVIGFPLNAEIVQTRKESLNFSAAGRLGDVWKMFVFTWCLSRQIRKLNVRIVHTNSLKSHVLGGIAARLAGARLVWHVRDRIADDYLPGAAQRLIRLLARMLPHFVIANSHATLKTLVKGQKQSNHTTMRYRVVHDGCDAALPVPPALPSTSTKIGLIGRISPWKGQHIFIRAAAIVRKLFPDARFVVIGAPLFSETTYETQLRELCRNLGIEEAVEFRGFVQDVPGALSELDMVVHASTTGEPFGQVVIEAMAAAKPVVATNGGGVPEIVVDHVTGLLVPMGDEKAMAEAMTSLLSDPSMAAEMGRRGRERVLEHFTLSRVAREVEQVYAGMLGGNALKVPPIVDDEQDVEVKESVGVTS